ncbi:tetratricopeptide repeat protein [Mastigocoleus testarum]|uniref:CHAT domain-containing protein n=1 Tax=Mastigocoleus testarum BC008 TaxID=371196 RepID=A0A0V7ZCL6_9CYAN|nr:tetratricopeptide repeat protein [Mastigocoleus testarum]KST62245.1 hypothetical protein BC008_08740 [Mastigocoleus testarum BC008]
MSPNSNQKFPISLKLLSYSITAMITLGLVVSVSKEVVGEIQALQSAEKSAELAEAEELIDKANKLREQGNYREAISFQEKALEIQEKVLGKEHLKIAITLNDLAEFYQLQGLYLKVEPLYLRSLKINERNNDDVCPHIASSLNGLGKLYQGRGIYARAERMYLRSLAIREKVLGKKHPDVAESLYNVAEIYRLRGNYDASEAFYLRSLAIREKIFGKKHPKVVKTLDGLLKLKYKLGIFGKFYDRRIEKELESFKSLHQRSVAIREKMLDEEYPDVAANLYHLAKLYSIYSTYPKDDNYKRAETLYQRSLAIQEELLGKEHPDVATTLHGLANLYKNDENGKKRVASLYLRSLVIREKVLGKEHPDVASILHDLAGFYESEMNFDEVEALYRRSLAIRKKALGQEHPDVGMTLLRIATYYNLFGSPDFTQEIFTINIAAESHYSRSLPIFEKIMGKENYIVADILQKLATIYREKGNYNQAEALYLRSLAIKEKLMGTEHFYVAHVLNDLVILYKLQKNYTKAESLLLRSLAIYEKKIAIDKKESNQDFSGQMVPALNYLGLIYNLQGKYEKAECVLLRSLAIQEKELDEELRILIGEMRNAIEITLNRLGVVYYSQGNYAKAESVLLRSVAISEKRDYHRLTETPTGLDNLAKLYWVQGKISKTIDFLNRRLAIEEKKIQLIYQGFSEQEKQKLAQYFNGSPNIAISLALQESNPSIAKLAMTTVLRHKGRVLDAMTDIVQTLRPHLAGNPKIKKSFDKWLDVKKQLAELVYRGRNKQNIEIYQQQIKKLNLENEELENELSFISKEFRKEIQPIELAPIQAKIPQNAALVEIIQYQPFNPKAQYHKRFDKPRYAAVVLHQVGEPKWVDLGKVETIDKSVENFRNALKSPVSYYKNQGEKVSRELDKLIMAPIRPLLGNANHLLLSPDGELNLIPFEALKDEKNQYLVERYSFSYLTTGRDLLRFNIQAKQLSDPVVFADIDYNNYENIMIAKNSNSKNQRSVDLTNLSYGSLPGTSLEGKAIQNIFPNTILITSKRATETTIKQLKTPSILHLATHAFFLENKNNNKSKKIELENPLLRSGLALAGFNNRQNKQSNNTEDGVLTALEIAGLDLRGTKLVVLSACETGLGEVKNSDGIYGLRRALVIAGSQAQLLSLWKVSDDGTKDLMVKYYDNLKAGKGRHESLREVQLEFIKHSKYNHPYYWASFIPTGNWKKI